MQEHPQEKNKKRFLLLSLLLHILLLYLFFHFLSYQNSHKTVADRSDSNKKDLKLSTLPTPIWDEPAQLKARQSEFGAPVIFAELPEYLERESILDQKDRDAAQDLIASNDEVTQIPSKFSEGREGVPSLKDVEESLSPHQTNARQEHMLVDLSYDAEPVPVAGKITALGDEKKLPAQKIASIENDVELKQKHQLPTLGKKRTSTRKKISNEFGQGNEARTAAPTNKKFTFADLAKGFMENVQSGGEDLINQRGDPRKHLSIEDLKLASYKQKIAWNMQAAFKRAARRTQFISQPPQTSRMCCRLYIEKEGNLAKIETILSTGHDELDIYILKAIKDAFPIPPIPDHWQKNMLVESWTFNDIQPNKSVPYTVNF